VGGVERPGTPSRLAASWQGTVVTLTWNPGSGASSHVIEVGSAAGASNLAVINTGAAPIYRGAVPPGTYYVRVRAANRGGVSEASNEIEVQGPGAPQRPTSLSSVWMNGAINLAWSAPALGQPVTGYLIEGGTAPGLANLGSIRVGPLTAFSAPATAVPAGTYYIRVRALNALGMSPPSNEIVVRR
jgi:predicted phage tail protein